MNPDLIAGFVIMTEDEMESHDQIKNGWFFETCPLWPGMGLSLEIEKTLYSKKSRFQRIEVYQTRHHGKMLALDGIIQLTESDEFAYKGIWASISW